MTGSIHISYKDGEFYCSRRGYIPLEELIDFAEVFLGTMTNQRLLASIREKAKKRKKGVDNTLPLSAKVGATAKNLV